MIDKYCKLILLGNTGVGKSSLLSHLTDEEQPMLRTSTIGVDYCSNMVRYQNYNIKLNIWDTAGQERFAPIIKSYYRDIDIAIIVFSLTSRESYNKISYWLEQLQSNTEGHRVVLVGNKYDLLDKRVIMKEEAKILADTLQIHYVETSNLQPDTIDTLKILVLEIFLEEERQRQALSTPPLRDSISLNIQPKGYECCK